MIEPSFIRDLRAKSRITELEDQVLTAAGINSAEELLALTWAVPGISRIGFDLARLSSTATRLSSRSFLAAAQASGTHNGTPPQFAAGANHPPGASKPPGFQIATPTGPIGPFLPPSVTAFDFNPIPWPVRDQGDRGTCVAFALAACREHQAACPDLDLSEQYLYWATKTKTGDSWPSDEGTLLEYGSDALSRLGVCERRYWPYNQSTIAGNVSQEIPPDPSATAHGDATKWISPTARYVRPSPGSGSRELFNTLQLVSAPVALSVELFTDCLNPRSTNWNWQPALDHGRVLDPLPTMISDGGHAVCITGYVPDVAAPGGGWFVFRNSWGTRWARAAKPPVTPEPGYGHISAAYVNEYALEIAAL